jgi:hypothetical protein
VNDTFLSVLGPSWSIAILILSVGLSLLGIGRRSYYGTLIALGAFVLVGTVMLFLSGKPQTGMSVLVETLSMASIVGGTFATILFRTKPKEEN